VRPGEQITFSYLRWLDRRDRMRRLRRALFLGFAITVFLAACWAWWVFFPEGGGQ
jgi:hypothetical protein